MGVQSGGEGRVTAQGHLLRSPDIGRRAGSLLQAVASFLWSRPVRGAFPTPVLPRVQEDLRRCTGRLVPTGRARPAPPPRPVGEGSAETCFLRLGVIF